MRFQKWRKLRWCAFVYKRDLKFSNLNNPTATVVQVTNGSNGESLCALSRPCVHFSLAAKGKQQWQRFRNEHASHRCVVQQAEKNDMIIWRKHMFHHQMNKSTVAAKQLAPHRKKRSWMSNCTLVALQEKMSKINALLPCQFFVQSSDNRHDAPIWHPHCRHPPPHPTSTTPCNETKKIYRKIWLRC